MTQHPTIRALPQTRKETRTISQDCSLSSTQSLAHAHARAHVHAHTYTHTNIFKRLIKINWQHQGEWGQGKGETYIQAWIRNCRGYDWCPGGAWLLRTQEICSPLLCRQQKHNLGRIREPLRNPARAGILNPQPELGTTTKLENKAIYVFIS